MTTDSQPQGRVGAAHRAKLKKWSDKVARDDDERAVVASAKDSAVRHRGPLIVAKEMLRKLFH